MLFRSPLSPPKGPTVNGYLTRLSRAAMLRNREKESVQRSINVMRRRLQRCFRQQISEQTIFGSYTRNTILPRRFDENSDIDYLVVFADGGFSPQTYLDRLRRFVEANYVRSEIHQSIPTIQLELNHIRFELVPATRNWWGSIQIPAKSSDFANWQNTDPDCFNRELTRKNISYGNKIKPLIRIVKCWNTTANYPFESFDLEKKIVEHIFLGVRSRLSDMLYDFSSDLNAGWSAPQWKHNAVQRFRNYLEEVQCHERRGRSEERRVGKECRSRWSPYH